MTGVDKQAHSLMLIDVLERYRHVLVRGRSVPEIFEALQSAPMFGGRWVHVARELGLKHDYQARYLVRQQLPPVLVQCPDVLNELCKACALGHALPEEIKQAMAMCQAVPEGDGDIMSRPGDGLADKAKGRAQQERQDAQLRFSGLVDVFQEQVTGILGDAQPYEVLVEFTGSPWSTVLWWMARRAFNGRCQFRPYMPLVDLKVAERYPAFSRYCDELVLHFGLDPIQFQPVIGGPIHPEAYQLWRRAIEEEEEDQVDEIMGEAMKHQAEFLVDRFRPRFILITKQDPIMPASWHVALADAVKRSNVKDLDTKVLDVLSEWNWQDVMGVFDRYQLLSHDPMMVTVGTKQADPETIQAEPGVDVLADVTAKMAAKETGRVAGDDLDALERLAAEDALIEGWTITGEGIQRRYRFNNKITAKAKVPDDVKAILDAREQAGGQ